MLDFETYSEAPLKQVGAFEYSIHPSTEILCLAFRIGTRASLKTATTLAWSPRIPSSNIQTLLGVLADPSVIVVAHNALFEQVIVRNVLGRILHTQAYLKGIPPSRWLCTAALAASLSLPRKLEGAAKVLKLPVQKDMEGNRLIQKWCKPRKPTKNNPATRHDDELELRRLIQYCCTDVDTEVELFLKAPPLAPTERRVWVLDQEINLRGVEVDRELVTSVLGMIATETERLLGETHRLSDGLLTSPKQTAKTLAWLAGEGVFLPNIQRKTVEDAISEGLVTGRAKKMLETRLEISKSSTAKYEAFDRRSSFDGRMRDNFLYHAASTGRWGGVGVQLQNLPARGTIKDSLFAATVLRDSDLEWVRTLYARPMDVFSSCLRNVIVAPKGKTLDVADYAAIEARVLFWVAKHADGVAAFHNNRPMYEELAATIFGVKLKDVTPAQRFVGKTALLGAGYGMGAPKFEFTCRNLGQEVSEELAYAAIRAYRTKHGPVVKLWKMIELAATAAIENPGKRYSINYTKWQVKDGFLWCELPSGRRLAYPNPSIRDAMVHGRPQRVIHHWGVGQNRKWAEETTWGGKLVENVVQAISRDLMAEAMLRIEAAGPWKIVLTVHDELGAERDLGSRATIDDFCRLMVEAPPWAEGCPIKAEGWTGARYRK